MTNNYNISWWACVQYTEERTNIDYWRIIGLQILFCENEIWNIHGLLDHTSRNLFQMTLTIICQGQGCRKEKVQRFKKFSSGSTKLQDRNSCSCPKSWKKHLAGLRWQNVTMHIICNMNLKHESRALLYKHSTHQHIDCLFWIKCNWLIYIIHPLHKFHQYIRVIPADGLERQHSVLDIRRRTTRGPLTLRLR